MECFHDRYRYIKQCGSLGLMSMIPSTVPSHSCMKRLWELKKREPEPELQPGLLWCQGQCTFQSMSKFPPTPSEVWADTSHCISRKQAIFTVAEGHGGAHGNSAYNIFVFLYNMHKLEVFLFSVFKCCSL